MADRPRIQVVIDENCLKKYGFIESGRKTFSDTVSDYANLLLGKAAYFAQADREEALPREVTHSHVRAGARIMAASFGRPRKPRWLIATQICEYVAAGCAGAGASNLDKSVGIAVFGLGLFSTAILVAVRLTYREEI
jgi:hypothetical protein